MAVYAEKRNGRTTGVFIAEVMHLGVRVRKRFDVKRDADRWQEDVKATGAPPPTKRAAEVPTFQW